MYCVYLLKSTRDDKYYIGYTGNIKKRFWLHNSGCVNSTRPRRPFRLVGFIQFEDSGKARYYEYQLKRHSDKKKKFIQSCLEQGLWVSDPEALQPQSGSGPEGM